MRLGQNLLQQGAAGGGEVPLVDEVFSTSLYTGNGSTQTITNGIDLAGAGGLVWFAARDDANNKTLYDTERGAALVLASNTSTAEVSASNGLTAFTSTGFSVGNGSGVNRSAINYASWTFRKAARFFDVVTYTGDGGTTIPQTIPHNLGMEPGMVIVKARSSSAWQWETYHRSLGATQKILLNTADAAISASGSFGGLAPTSLTFTVGYNGTNQAGTTYVAYLFAHDSGPDGVIQCGSYTGTSAAGNQINLGWEPQFLLVRRTDGSDNWSILDSARGFGDAGTNSGNRLFANTTDVEFSSEYFTTNATGFAPLGGAINTSGGNYIYIAIRKEET